MKKKEKELLETLSSQIKSKQEFDELQDQLFKRGKQSLLNEKHTVHLA